MKQLLFAQDQVHDPTPTDMLPRFAAVGENGGIVAAHFLQGIRKDGKAGVVERSGGKEAVLVGGCGSLA